jgi:hypothetical protein
MNSSEPSEAKEKLPLPDRRTPDLFLVSLLILFFELACIRWFSAHIIFLTFFTNMVLLAAFLGMSLGCLAASHRRNYLWATPYLLGVAVAAGIIVDATHLGLQEFIDVGNQKSPELVYFGAETATKESKWLVPIELLAGVFFLLVTLSLVGPGQQLGRALAADPNRVRAYTFDILGSLTGILLFGLCSWMQLPPFFWFLPVTVGIAYFLWNSRKSDGQLAARNTTYLRVQYGVACATLLVVLALASWNTGKGLATWDAAGKYTGERPVWVDSIIGPFSPIEQKQWASEHFWSPYYRIDYKIPPTRAIAVNLIGHQQMRDASLSSTENPFVLSYALPHLFHKDSGGKPFNNVLIVGAGSGNDVAMSLRFGAQHVDAVEIDPVIQSLGARDHPNNPYGDERVTRHNDDGRNFLRSLPADRKYDLVVFALVDSLVLHSGYSNIRLESYLFTKQCFDDVREHLKPDGVFVMYNYFRQDWIVARLEQGLKESFRTDPMCWKWYSFTIMMAGPKEGLEPIRRQFEEHKTFWIDARHPLALSSPNGFVEPPEGERSDYDAFQLVNVPPVPGLRTATDDWPFLYLREPTIPLQPNLTGMLMMAVLAVGLILCFLPRSTETGNRWSFDGGMFFLGAGFMLIETKAVVHMALLFGSTWMVNSVVFFAVLVMILLANLFVLKFRPKNLVPYFVGLLAALALNAVVPLDFFLGWPWVAQVVTACSLVFAPILFAGVIFAVSFSWTESADRAFGANIAGAMLGGLAENLSMIVGFRYIVLVAMAFYLLAMLWKRQPMAVSAKAEAG